MIPLGSPFISTLTGAISSSTATVSWSAPPDEWDWRNASRDLRPALVPANRTRDFLDVVTRLNETVSSFNVIRIVNYPNQAIFFCLLIR